MYINIYIYIIGSPLASLISDYITLQHRLLVLGQLQNNKIPSNTKKLNGQAYMEGIVLT
jgi:hypothetical protein